MLPFLELSNNIQESKNNKISKNSPLEIQEEKSDFGEFLNNFLSLSKEDKEKEIKNFKTDSKENLLNPKNKEKQEGFLQTLEDKYNLLDNFKSKNTKENLEELKNIKNIPQKEMEIKTDKKEINTRDLKLEAQSFQKKTKTLKDVVEVAKELKLNLKQIVLENKQAQNSKEIPNISEKFFVNTKKEDNKTTNVFNQILQDKDLIKEAKENKKETKTNKQSQEILINKEISKKQDIKDIKEKLNINVAEQKESKIETKKEAKEEAQKVEDKNFKDINNIKEKDKNILETKEIKISQENPKESKELNNPLQKEVKNKEAQDTKEDKKGKDTQKQIKTSELQTDMIKDNVSKESKIQEPNYKDQKIKNEEVLKEGFNKEQENIKKPEILKEALTKEVQKEVSKEVQKEVSVAHKKEEKQTREVAQDKKATKDKYKQGDLFATLQDSNPQEVKNINSKQEEQRAGEVEFLNNLLRTNSTKDKVYTKETQEIMQTKEKEKEKEKNEVLNASFQTQIQRERVSITQTFSYFSTNLKDVIVNYRPPVTKLTLELNPQNLGSVELTLIKRGDNIHIQIGSNPQALQLFMQHKEEFKKELSNMGFNDITMDFKDIQGKSLELDFGGNGGGNFGNNSHGNNNPQSQDSKKWNENGLSAYKEAKEVQNEIARLELSFSYYA
ncbi:flagellar hook-length control protein FliK [Helicobacter burdigaliensis]|uniref:flagellar hook-length control protein FliK n=1 Tax=Helicobacter burdigaliensis TaxID=2315334 RepID=UPI000EF73449|nr:flagellar hook-length control protein FliK [Helicobacter burdigaliensis]